MTRADEISKNRVDRFDLQHVEMPFRTIESIELAQGMAERAGFEVLQCKFSQKIAENIFVRIRHQMAFNRTF